MLHLTTCTDSVLVLMKREFQLLANFGTASIRNKMFIHDVVECSCEESHTVTSLVGGNSACERRCECLSDGEEHKRTLRGFSLLHTSAPSDVLPAM